MTTNFTISQLIDFYAKNSKTIDALLNLPLATFNGYKKAVDYMNDLGWSRRFARYVIEDVMITVYGIDIALMAQIAYEDE